MGPTLLLLALLSQAHAQGSGDAASRAACPPAPADPAAHYRGLVDDLLTGMLLHRDIHMRVELAYNADMPGPLYSGGDGPPLNPGSSGRIWIGAGLASLCLTRDEAAFAFGHELAHLYLGHSKVRMDEWVTWRGRGTATAGDDSRRRTRERRAADREGMERYESAGGARPAGSEFSYGWFGVDNAAFLRRHEDQADQLGMAIAAQAGFDSRASVTFFERVGHLWPGANIRDPHSRDTASRDRASNAAYWADRFFPAVSASGGLPGAGASTP